MRTELEERIHQAEALGQKWATIHESWLQLDEDKKNYLSSLMNDLDDGEKSDVKLERLARGSKQFRDYVRLLCIAKGEELRAKVKYENARDLFEAARSKEATSREQLKTLKFIP